MNNKYLNNPIIPHCKQSLAREEKKEERVFNSLLKKNLNILKEECKERGKGEIYVNRYFDLFIN